ncbi:hypothetical protein BACCAC_02203 [Bacteroides caccae ATCC 43185]|nr:hypothetical protein BACCAC_02203 [Bacteroides caccae ATCC 43185]
MSLSFFGFGNLKLGAFLCFLYFRTVDNITNVE